MIISGWDNTACVVFELVFQFIARHASKIPFTLISEWFQQLKQSTKRSLLWLCTNQSAFHWAESKTLKPRTTQDASLWRNFVPDKPRVGLNLEEKVSRRTGRKELSPACSVHMSSAKREGSRMKAHEVRYSTSAIFEGRFSLITWNLLNYHTCAVWQIFNSSSYTILDATHPSMGIRSIQNSVFGFVQYLLHTGQAAVLWVCWRTCTFTPGQRPGGQLCSLKVTHMYQSSSQTCDVPLLFAVKIKCAGLQTKHLRSTTVACRQIWHDLYVLVTHEKQKARCTVAIADLCKLPGNISFVCVDLILCTRSIFGFLWTDQGRYSMVRRHRWSGVSHLRLMRSMWHSQRRASAPVGLGTTRCGLFSPWISNADLSSFHRHVTPTCIARNACCLLSWMTGGINNSQGLQDKLTAGHNTPDPAKFEFTFSF